MDLPERANWFTSDHGVPRPDWSIVDGWRRAHVARAKQDEFWHCFVRRWLDTLSQALPGHYKPAESENFHFFSELDEKSGTRMLRFLEESRSHIQKVVGDTSQTDWHGKHLVLRFSDVEMYYRYIAHFYPDGEHAASAGCFLRSQYCHIVYPASWSMDDERATLAHEMTHNLLVELPLPAWLNEALAMAFQADVSGLGHGPLTADLSERHREYWSASSIQEFWAGSSFGTQEGQELSYSLARVLLNLIHSDVSPGPDEFRRFVLASDWHDAGAIACRENLRVELGELAGSFLGPGNWEPKPTDWELYKSKAEEADENNMEFAVQASGDSDSPICDRCGVHAPATGRLLGKVIYRCAAGHEFMRG